MHLDADVEDDEDGLARLPGVTTLEPAMKALRWRREAIRDGSSWGQAPK